MPRLHGGDHRVQFCKGGRRVVPAWPTKGALVRRPTRSLASRRTPISSSAMGHETYPSLLSMRGTARPGRQTGNRRSLPRLGGVSLADRAGLSRFACRPLFHANGSGTTSGGHTGLDWLGLGEPEGAGRVAVHPALGGGRCPQLVHARRSRRRRATFAGVPDRRGRFVAPARANEPEP